jgi:hypothetical protein
MWIRAAAASAGGFVVGTLAWWVIAAFTPGVRTIFLAATAGTAVTTRLLWRTGSFLRRAFAVGVLAAWTGLVAVIWFVGFSGHVD